MMKVNKTEFVIAGILLAAALILGATLLPSSCSFQVDYRFWVSVMSWLEDISALPIREPCFQERFNKLMRALMLLVILASFVSCFIPPSPHPMSTRTLL